MSSSLVDRNNAGVLALKRKVRRTHTLINNGSIYRYIKDILAYKSSIEKISCMIHRLFYTAHISINFLCWSEFNKLPIYITIMG